MIKCTDFNVDWPIKISTLPLSETEERFGKILWAADFLSAFSHPDNIPKIVRDLYWENQSRAVKYDETTRTVNAYRLQRNSDGTLVTQEARDSEGKLIYKPVLEVAPEDAAETDYATIMEVKFV